MAVDEIVVAAATGRPVAGFFADGSLVRVEFAAAPADRRLGEIVLGRIRRTEAGLDAAFVDIGDGLSGFLNRADAGTGRRSLGEGDAVLVQIGREAEAEKAAKLTAAVCLPGRTLLYCPAGHGVRPDAQPAVRVSRRITDEADGKRLLGLAGALPGAEDGASGGWFVRRAAVGADADAIAGEAEALLATWSRLEALAKAAKAPARLWRPPDPVLVAIGEEAGAGLERIVADEPGILNAIRAHRPDLRAEFRLVAGADAAAAVAALEAGIDAMLAPDVGLPGGGAIRIAETPALVAIDVDAGSRRTGGGEDTALAVNLEAVAAIAREVRRRELAGHIVVDFIALRRQAHRDRVLQALRSALAGDRLSTHVAGYTALGKVELSRRRVRPSLRSRLCAPCPACAGSGRVLSPEAAARRALRLGLHELAQGAAGQPTVVATPRIAAALRGPAADAVAAVEARLGRTLVLREDPGADVGAAADAVRFEIAGGSGSGRER